MSKAVFFDIDGTLINIHNNQTRMSTAVRSAIHDLRAAGHHTFIATGRPWAYLSPELTESGLFDGFIVMNGAAVLLEGKVIYQKPLPMETVKQKIGRAHV